MPLPSLEDILVTRDQVNAGRLIDVQLVDRVIVRMGYHVSMKDRGRGF